MIARLLCEVNSDGWYVTDMAIAEQSFHWEGCEKADAVPTHTAGPHRLGIEPIGDGAESIGS